MSNEYIVVKTTKNSTNIWNTITSTYTPDAGEVCIIVPNKSQFSYTEDSKDGLTTRDPDTPTIGIKIGNGKTAFQELPTLTDISQIHPDWHETDTNSPNYIWHKPITNNDMFIISDKLVYILEDPDIAEILENGYTKIYHNEEYCFVKDLTDQILVNNELVNLFKHPNDLLIEEDNTWGHYDVYYNDTETQHAPRFFYINNIAKQTDAIKYAENDGSYRFRLESLLEELIYSVLKYSGDFKILFNYATKEIDSIPEIYNVDNFSKGFIYLNKADGKYYEVYENIADKSGYFLQIDFFDSNIVTNYIKLLANDVADYLITHEGVIEYQTLYSICLNRLLGKDSDDEILTDYELTLSTQFQNADYDRNIDVIKTQNFAGYLYQEMIEPVNSNNIKIRVNESLFEYFEINDEVIIDMSDSTYPGLYFKKRRLQHYYEQAHGVQEYIRKGEVGDSIFKIPFDISETDRFGADYVVEISNSTEIKTLTYPSGTKTIQYADYFDITTAGFQADMNYVNIEVKYKDLEETRGYTNGLTTPLTVPWNHSVVDTIKVYADPADVTWEYKHNSTDSPLFILPFDSQVDIEAEIANTTIKMVTQDKDGDYVETILQYLTDYVYSVGENANREVIKQVRLINPIKDSCELRFTTRRDRIQLEYEWVEGETDQINLLKNPITEGEGLIIFERTRPAFKLFPNETDTDGYTINEANGTIILNETLYGEADITLSKSQIIDITEANIDIVDNELELLQPLLQEAIIYFKRKSLAGGKLSIHFPYRLRRLNDKFLSNYQSDWDENNSQAMSFILHRPLWKNESTGEIEMSAKNGIYSNTQTTYYEFFKALIEDVFDTFLDKDELSKLADRVAELERWREDDVDEYLEVLQNFEFEGYGGAYKGDWLTSGVIKALQDIINAIQKLENRVETLENSSDIWIGSTKPALNAEGKQIYKLWVNTAEENGNGIMYYYRKGVWTPISSVWTPPDSGNAIT